MMADEGALRPITPERMARELIEISSQRRNGEIDAATYDQIFARMIGELRDRRIDGSRADIMATLNGLVTEGKITAGEFDRVVKQLGLT
ncbi:MAG: hypothetical protein ACOY71_11915 [Gemmatimonadota bacterium]